ncbi:MAG TPA: TetR/AcrR family transcriptional regulator [Hyphomonadaceae bacterium]|nr:TetR/AcrR family transcriptional regulator [Hyphomonadaceae bacterium]
MQPASDTDQSDKAPSRKYSQKRDQILQRAAEKFNTLGVRGATLADIAASVDLNLTSIRHYYIRKEDLVAAAFLRSIEVHTSRLEKSRRAGPPEARVRDLVHRYFEFRRRIRLGEEQEIMIFGDLRSLAEPQANEVWPKYVNLFRTVREIVADPDEIDADRQRVNARAHTLISQFMRSVFWLPDYDVEDFGRVEARFIDILLNGLAGPGFQFADAGVHLPEEAPPDKRSRESFLLAATRLINEQGYRGASVERIAARLNVTKGSFYHHIDAKDDLVVACFKRNTQILNDALRLAIASQKTGIRQALAAAGMLVRRQQTPAGPLLRNSALMSVDQETRIDMLRQMGHVVERFTDMVSDGIMDGSARVCDPRVAGQMLMAMVNSASELKNWVPDLTAENSVELYARPLFKGLFA